MFRQSMCGWLSVAVPVLAWSSLWSVVRTQGLGAASHRADGPHIPKVLAQGGIRMSVHQTSMRGVTAKEIRMKFSLRSAAHGLPVRGAT